VSAPSVGCPAWTPVSSSSSPRSATWSRGSRQGCPWPSSRKRGLGSNSHKHLRQYTVFRPSSLLRNGDRCPNCAVSLTADERPPQMSEDLASSSHDEGFGPGLPALTAADARRRPGERGAFPLSPSDGSRSKSGNKFLKGEMVMQSQRSSSLFAALVAAGFLLLVAWGNALALLVASALAMVIGGVFFRPRNARAAALVALIGAIVAAVIVAVAKRLQ
jgi:hypothetical protein